MYLRRALPRPAALYLGRLRGVTEALTGGGKAQVAGREQLAQNDAQRRTNVVQCLDKVIGGAAFNGGSMVIIHARLVRQQLLRFLCLVAALLTRRLKASAQGAELGMRQSDGRTTVMAPEAFQPTRPILSYTIPKRNNWQQ